MYINATGQFHCGWVQVNRTQTPRENVFKQAAVRKLFQICIRSLTTDIYTERIGIMNEQYF